MHDPINELKESAQDVRLPRAAFERMRGALAAHLAAHPSAVPSPYARFFALNRPVAALALIALIGAGGATASAAHGALPGDALYPLKVRIIEPAEGLLAVTPEARATWKASIANERISEVAQLAAREKLTPAQSASSERDFNESFHAAEKAVQTLSKDDPQTAARIRSSLSASLAAHQRAIEAAGLSASTTNAQAAHQFSVHLKGELESEDGGDADGEDREEGRLHGVPTASSTPAIPSIIRGIRHGDEEGERPDD